MDIPLALLFLIPPAAALSLVHHRFYNESKPRTFQFGLSELLVLPLAMTPTILMFISAATKRGDGEYVWAVFIYQVSFALLIWSDEKKGLQGWDPAFSLLIGAVTGLAVMVLSVVATAAILIFCAWNILESELKSGKCFRPLQMSQESHSSNNHRE